MALPMSGAWRLPSPAVKPTRWSGPDALKSAVIGLGLVCSTPPSVEAVSIQGTAGAYGNVPAAIRAVTKHPEALQTGNHLDGTQQYEALVLPRQDGVLAVQQGWDRPGQRSTGAAVWTGASVLTKYMETELRQQIRDASVVELGAGCGLGAIQAQWLGAETAVATDGDPAVLELAKENVRINAKAGVGAGTVAVEKLYWGDAADISKVLEVNQGRPFRWIIGADITYKRETWPLLVETIRQMSGKDTRILLAMEPRLRDEVEGLRKSALEKGLSFEEVRLPSKLNRGGADACGFSCPRIFEMRLAGDS